MPIFIGFVVFLIAIFAYDFKHSMRANEHYQKECENLNMVLSSTGNGAGHTYICLDEKTGSAVFISKIKPYEVKK